MANGALKEEVVQADVLCIGGGRAGRKPQPEHHPEPIHSPHINSAG